MSKNSTGKSKLPIVIVTACVLVIVALAVVIMILFQELNNRQQPTPTPQSTSGKGNLVVDESNLETIENQLESSVQDGMFQVNMNTTWHFDEGNPTSKNAYVANAASNHYPITFEVYLNGEEELYTSTLMPVGSQLKEVTLNQNLPKGTYDAVCTYHLWNEQEEEVGTFGVNVIISIE